MRDKGLDLKWSIFLSNDVLLCDLTVQISVVKTYFLISEKKM